MIEAVVPRDGVARREQVLFGSGLVLGRLEIGIDPEFLVVLPLGALLRFFLLTFPLRLLTLTFDY